MSQGLEIHEAASTGDFDTLEEYLRSGKFDVNMRDEEWNNRTALHWACAKGYVECIRLLLDHGAIGTIRNDSGWTPAHFAAVTEKLTSLRALYNASVPIGLQDKYGDTPRRIAQMYGHTECVKFFDQCEAETAAGITSYAVPPKSTAALRQTRGSHSHGSHSSHKHVAESPTESTMTSSTETWTSKPADISSIETASQTATYPTVAESTVYTMFEAQQGGMHSVSRHYMSPHIVSKQER